jgi:hypothetical protein
MARVAAERRTVSAPVVLIDTSIFDELLAVPEKSQHREATLEQLADWHTHRANLLLPMATIIETGNHIAQVKGDKAKFALAQRYVEQVSAALQGESPFVATPSFEPPHMLGWIASYPEHAMRKIGAADLSIIDEFDRQCRLNPRRRVLIWTRDQALVGYDRAP